MLFPGRKAWWYIERHPLAFSKGGSQGHSFFRAPNPPFGAVFTYYLKEDLLTEREARIESEKETIKSGADTPFTGYDAVEEERRETKPEVWLTVRDADDNIVRRIEGPVKKGFHRVAWDLRFPAVQPVSLAKKLDPDRQPQGFLATPGTYTVTLSKRVKGITTELVSAKEFEVERLRSGALEGADTNDVVAFWERTAELQRSVTAASSSVTALDKRVTGLKRALARTRSAPEELEAQWQDIRTELFEIEEALSGNQSMNEVGQELPPTVQGRLGKVLIGVGNSTYGPTETHKDVLDFAETDFIDLRDRINELLETTIPELEMAIFEADGPWVPGGIIP